MIKITIYAQLDPIHSVEHHVYINPKLFDEPDGKTFALKMLNESAEKVLTKIWEIEK
jgi:hypothetical protein